MLVKSSKFCYIRLDLPNLVHSGVRSIIISARPAPNYPTNNNSLCTTSCDPFSFSNYLEGQLFPCCVFFPFSRFLTESNFPTSHSRPLFSTYARIIGPGKNSGSLWAESKSRTIVRKAWFPAVVVKNLAAADLLSLSTTLLSLLVSSSTLLSSMLLVSSTLVSLLVSLSLELSLLSSLSLSL